jgi:hypothetical protein
VFELDDFWLGLGAGLVTGNLSSWVTAPMETARGERVQGGCCGRPWAVSA